MTVPAYIYEVTRYRSIIVFEIEDESPRLYRCVCANVNGYGHHKTIRKAVLGDCCVGGRFGGSSYFENIQGAIGCLRERRAEMLRQHRKEMGEIDGAIEYAVLHKKTGAA